ncbi:FkbM family methyltransferase [Oceanibium sediminis]|uniref:FkbM family methyltransferase n=1 Tax=Oceanibium sediminis TaxID=2026339 RepID=UPI001300AAC4|nr:FkbM family methyltransferase [Oceanibium sediminis]
MKDQVQIHGVSLPTDQGVLTDLLLREITSGVFEQEEIAALKAVLRPGDRVLDIGGGLGVTSSFIAARPGIRSVTVVEPNPNTQAYLRAVHALNKVTVTILEGVLSAAATPGERDFYVRPHVFGSSLFAREDGSGRRVRVRAIPLREVLADLRPTVISCDIEGGEIELFAGAALPGVRAIVMEVHPRITGRPAIRDMMAHLRAIGFRPQRALSSAEVKVLTRPFWRRRA